MKNVIGFIYLTQLLGLGHQEFVLGLEDFVSLCCDGIFLLQLLNNMPGAATSVGGMYKSAKHT